VARRRASERFEDRGKRRGEFHRPSPRIPTGCSKPAYQYCSLGCPKSFCNNIGPDLLWRDLTRRFRNRGDSGRAVYAGQPVTQAVRKSHSLDPDRTLEVTLT
jgi:hypothetical protein